MPEKIDFEEIMNKSRNGDKKCRLIEFALLTAVSKPEDEEKFNRAFSVTSPKDQERGPIEIELKINGEEFDFSHVVVRFYENIDYALKTIVSEMIGDKVSDCLEDVEEACTDFRKSIERMSREHFQDIL